MNSVSNSSSSTTSHNNTTTNPGTIPTSTVSNEGNAQNTTSTNNNSNPNVLQPPLTTTASTSTSTSTPAVVVHVTADHNNLANAAAAAAVAASVSGGLLLDNRAVPATAAAAAAGAAAATTAATSAATAPAQVQTQTQATTRTKVIGVGLGGPLAVVRTGPCALGPACSAPDGELSEQYRCRFCNKQLHGFISGCSQARNPKDFRDGVICKEQPCYQGDQVNPPNLKLQPKRTDGAAIAAAAGLPKFLWATQQPKRKRDPNAPKQRRQRYTKQHKEMVLQTLHNTPGSKLPDIAKQYAIPEGTLRGWYDEERRQKTTTTTTTTPPSATITTTSTPTTTNPTGFVPSTTADATTPTAAPAAETPAPPLDDMEDINEQILDPPIEEAAVSAVVTAAQEEQMPDQEQHQQQQAPPPHQLQPPQPPDDMTAEQPPQKKKRQRYSNETKIQVILALETRSNVSLNEVAKEFNVAAGTVRGWREEADKIQKQAMENRRVGAKANPSRDPLRRVWDAILSLFEKNSRLPLQQRLEVNVAVVRTIGKQARDILLQAHDKDPFLTPTEYVNMEKFKASETWARKWARDHQVISAKPETKTQAQKAQSKLAFLQKIVSEYPPDRVYTMTPTVLFYRILPHRTYVSKLGTQKRVRACKGLKSIDRLTLYLCTNESGTEKLPITCIGKYENPACFQVNAQKRLPYLSQKQALSDAGTFQRWWRTVFLPHVRARSMAEDDEDGKCLLLVEDMGPCKAELLKDPTGQVRVESLPASHSNTMTYSVPKDAHQHQHQQLLHTANNSSTQQQTQQQPPLPQCQALEYGILETIKRRYRYRLLQEVMDAFDERAMRRQVADNANFPIAARGLREGSLSNVADAMRLLQNMWDEVATTTIAKSWQRTKLRAKSKEDSNINALPPGQRAKSEKRQTTRQKKQLIKDLNAFLTKHESKDFSKETNTNQLEEMVEKLKNCFLYTDGEVIETKEMIESLEEWIGLEDSQGMVSLFMEEIKQEMNIEYLVGLKEPVEGVVPEAEEDEDMELDQPIEATETQNGKSVTKDKELDIETAIELATTIKSTACKLFQHGNILGELAVRLDDASDAVFRLLRKQTEQAEAKKEAEKAKATAKIKAEAKAAAATNSNCHSPPLPTPTDATMEDLNTEVDNSVSAMEENDYANAVADAMADVDLPADRASL